MQALIWCGVLSAPLLGHAIIEEDATSLIQAATSVGVRSKHDDLSSPSHDDLSPSSQLPVIPSSQFRNKVAATQAEFRGKCPERARRNECEVARKLVDALVRIAQGHARDQAELARTRVESSSSTESGLTMQSAMAVALHHWLHNRRPFEALDSDHSGKISYQEAVDGFKTMGLSWHDSEDMFQLMDNDSDGELSRDDVFTFLRAAVMVREKVPEIDIIDPEARAEEAFHRARTATQEEYSGDQLPFVWKVVMVLFITIIAAGGHFLIKSYGPEKLVGERTY